jgi:hypothetical protein
MSKSKLKNYNVIPLKQILEIPKGSLLEWKLAKLSTNSFLTTVFGFSTNNTCIWKPHAAFSPWLSFYAITCHTRQEISWPAEQISATPGKNLPNCTRIYCGNTKFVWMMMMTWNAHNQYVYNNFSECKVCKRNFAVSTQPCSYAQMWCLKSTFWLQQMFSQSLRNHFLSS